MDRPKFIKLIVRCGLMLLLLALPLGLWSRSQIHSDSQRICGSTPNCEKCPFNRKCTLDVDQAADQPPPDSLAASSGGQNVSGH